MNALRKFDYLPNPEHILVLTGRKADDILSKQCPILVGGLRDIAATTSSARLYLSGASSAQTVALGLAFAETFGGSENLPDEIREDVKQAGLFLAVTSSTLAQRYLNGTLEPELHQSGEATRLYALAQVRQEDEPIAEESDSDRIVTEGDFNSSPVNSANDGIA